VPCPNWIPIEAVKLGLPRHVSAAVDESKNPEEQRNGRQEEDQDAVPQRFASLRAGGRGILVTHRAALRGGMRRDQRDEARQAKYQRRYPHR
jgi:hypothetical protein